MIIRRVLLLLIGGAAVFLVPWTAYPADTLPAEHNTNQWRLAWVGFDIALVCCFAVATWLGLSRRREAVPLLAGTAALLCCDAWFDVVLDWTEPDRWTSVAMAVLVEVPIAILLGLRSRLLLTGGMPSRVLTLQDIEIHADASYQRLLRNLGTLGAAQSDTLTTALGRRGSEVTLHRLAGAGYVRQSGDGRWRPGRQTLWIPTLDEINDSERPKVAAFLEAKYAAELQLLTWAANHRDEFDSWGKGERAVTHLTVTELASFNAEYNELLIRYCLLHAGPTAGTREVAIRFYAFPFPEHPINDVPDKTRIQPHPAH
jgi:hypothetical protein